MRAMPIGGADERSWAIVLATGDDPMLALRSFAGQHQLQASRFTGIGAFSDVVLGFFEWEKKDYRRIPLAEQVEVVSLIGDITTWRDQPMVHAHVVVGRADGSTMGGHLLEAHVRPTLEVMLVESPADLRRRWDPEAGLPLLDGHEPRISNTGLRP